MDLVQRIIETATPFMVLLFWTLAVLVVVAASSQNPLGKKFIELVANIATGPEDATNPSARFKTQAPIPIHRPK
jgi:hypothetical protein